MHSPTLLLMTAVLMGCTALMLRMAWQHNRQAAGIDAWALGGAAGFLYCLSLAIPTHWPEIIRITPRQFFFLGMACLNLLAALAYSGIEVSALRRWRYGTVIFIVSLVIMSAIWPSATEHLAISNLIAGLLFLACAGIMLRNTTPSAIRRLYGFICAAHGLFLIACGGMKADSLFFNPVLPITIAQLSLIETAIVSLVLAFSAVMLVNEQIVRKLRHVAERDALTGVFNRRSFLARLHRNAVRLERRNQPISVVQIDLDHFKRINDNAGHKTGDKALRHFVRIAQACIREGDLIGRLGGEEFGLLLPDTDHEEAQKIAQRLRTTLEATPLVYKNTRIVLTASIGIACKLKNESLENTLHRADKAMYRAKRTGRNRVEMAADNEATMLVTPLYAAALPPKHISGKA